MSISIDDFWRLLTESQLLPAPRCEELGHEFRQVKGASQQSNSPTLAAWLQSQNLITRYQAKILLAGRPGPFVYGEYAVEDRIKDGPLASHFQARHMETLHPVTLVFLSGTAVQVPRLWNQIFQRVASYCEVVHPHLARCHEVVDLTSYKYLVLEALKGQCVQDVLASAGGRFPPQEACRIARQAALGLGQLHQSGHIRGDIRPAAIWMEPGGNVKLPHNPAVQPGHLDLKSFDPSERLLDRADYLAPELIQEGKSPDVLTDLYGLGCTLYALLAGQPPFPAGNVSQKMTRHATEPIRPLDTTFGVPEPISQTVAYMMAKNPSVRYQSAVDVANALGQYVDHSVVTPLPGMAVPTLPAFETAIMAKRARQATQAVGVAPTSAPAPAQPASPILVIKTEPDQAPSPSVPATSKPEPDSKTAETTDPEKVSDATESPTPDDDRPWNTRRLIMAGVVAAVLLIAVGIVTWSSCSAGSSTGDGASETRDDEGGTDDATAGD
jgi:serine/threonine protein kinase